MNKIIVIALAMLVAHQSGFAQNEQTQKAAKEPIQVNGVFPSLTILGSSDKTRSESGIGALIPWADKLWIIGYVAHIKGSRLGLYEINDDMTMVKHPQSVTGTYANRMIHNDSEQAIIGPHFIDNKGEVRTSTELSKHRLAATMEHLLDPKTRCIFLRWKGCSLNVMLEP